MAFISFSCLIALARTYSTMLNRSGESGYLYPVPELRGEAFNLSPLSMMLPVRLSYMAFIILRYAPSIPNLLRVFIMKGCCFFCIYQEDHIIFILHSINVIIKFIDLHMLNHPCITGINLT